MKPRILHLVDSFNEGGSERQALELVRLLRDSGRYEVFLATLNSEGVLRPEAESVVAEIPSYPLETFYDWNAGVQLTNFVKYLRSNEIDLIHTHDFYTNVFGMAAGLLGGVKTRIASRRETDFMRTKGQLILQRISYMFAHRIIANSQGVRAKLIGEGVNEKLIAVIHNGIDLKRAMSPVAMTREDIIRSLGLEKALDCRGFVTIIANMRHEVKDYPMFLHAAQKVKEALPETGFLLAGDGHLRSSIEELSAELGLTGNVFFLGRCSRLGELLNLSDVCVLSSKAEGFSNSILEYMAAARPVVATDVGGAREAIVEGETGYLVDPGDHTCMADRIVSLLLSPEKARALGEKGRQRVAQTFSLQSLLQNTEALYDSLLNDRPLLDVSSRQILLPQATTKR